MEEKKMATAETATTETTAKVTKSSQSTKEREEKIRNLAEKLLSIEIQNVPDEQEPPSLFNINGVEVLPKDAVGIIAAQKKSGKSNFTGLLMAASASPNHQVLNGAIRSNEGKLKILNIDTEQPLRDARRTLRRIMKTAGYDYGEQWNTHGIVSLSVKDIEEADRMTIIELAIKKYEPQLVFVDGIADLIGSINDEREAKEVMAWMDYLSCEYDCAVVGMLHLNFNSGKIGGWAGTQANKKFTDSFILKKDKSNGFFTVEHEGRGESAPNLRFKIVCPYGQKVGWWETVDISSIPELTQEDAEEMELHNLMDAAPLPCTNTQLISWLMNVKRWTSKSPADKTLKKCKQYGILDSRREGRQSVWYVVTTPDAQEQELNLSDD